MSQQYTLPEGLTNRNCEKSVSDRPPLPFMPLTTSNSEDAVLKNMGELHQLKIKVSEDLKVPKSIYDGGTPEQFLYHIQQTLDIRKILFTRWDSLEIIRKEKYANLQSLRGELENLKEQQSVLLKVILPLLAVSLVPAHTSKVLLCSANILTLMKQVCTCTQGRHMMLRLLRLLFRNWY